MRGRLTRRRKRRNVYGPSIGQLVRPSLKKRTKRIVDGLVIGIVVGLVVAFVVAYTKGATPALMAKATWNATLSAIAFLMAALATHYSLRLPAWIWALMWAALLRLGWRAWVRFSESISSSTPEPEPLSPPEVTVMQVMAAAGGEWVAYDQLQMHVSLHPIIVKDALSKLEGRKLIMRNTISLGPTYAATQAGREYIIAQGWIA